MLNEDKLIPFHAYNPTGIRVLVIAPHPDDETIGCGGALALHVEAGDPVRVIFLTNGAKGDVSGRFEREDYIRLRQEEARSASACLGITDIAFWPYEDRCLTGAPGALKRLMDTVTDFSPDLIYVPSPLEFHPDHRAATVLVWDLSRSIADDFQVMFYEVNQPFRINTLVDITRVLNKKEQAIQIYASQIAERPYDSVCLSLNRFRSLTLSAPCTHAEGFYIATLNQIREVGLYHLPFQQMDVLLPTFPEYGPLVSVIVRTKDRPELLFHAIQSIVQQSYANIEIIVVNDGGKDVQDIIRSIEGHIPVTYLVNQTNLGRSAAANLGIKAAKGAYLNFLDDDDILYPDHIEKLMRFILVQNAHVAYAGVLNAYYNGLPDTSGSRIKEEIIFNRPFDADLLLFENYIPFMSVLFSKDVAEAAGFFCEEMDLFEDWDFWVRASRQFRFHHLDAVTSEYRFYGYQSVEQSHDDKYRYSDAQALFFERNKKFMTGRSWSVFFSRGLPGRMKEEIKNYQSYQSGLIKERNSYHTYAENLAAEKQSYIDYIGQLKAEIQSHIDHIGQVKEEILSYIDYNGQLKAENQFSKDYIENLEKEKNNYLARIGGMDGEIQNHQTSIHNLKNMVLEKESQLKKMCLDLHEKDEQICRLSIMTSSADKSIASMKSELEETRESLNQSNARLQTVLESVAQTISAEQSLRNWVEQNRKFRITASINHLFQTGRFKAVSVTQPVSVDMSDYRMVQDSGLFDTEYYCRKHPEVLQSGIDPLVFYLQHGYKIAASVNPLFDGIFYLQNNPDLMGRDIDPLLHYIRYGTSEGRYPHPLFDTAFYCGTYPDIMDQPINPLAHFMTIGASLGYSPHPLFDTRFYMIRYGDDVLESGMNPLAHYMTIGAAKGYHPHALFDTSFYLGRNPDIADSAINPLLHFIEYGGAEKRDPNPIFDMEYYSAQIAGMEESDGNPLLHYLKIGVKSGLNPDQLFNTRYYLKKYPDVAQSGLNPLAHYLEFGCHEGHVPHPLFEPVCKNCHL